MSSVPISLFDSGPLASEIAVVKNYLTGCASGISIPGEGIGGNTEQESTWLVTRTNGNETTNGHPRTMLPLALSSPRDRQSDWQPSSDPANVDAARGDTDLECYEPGTPWTARCRYCGWNHQCDDDGVVQGSCQAEREFRAAHGGRSWWGVMLWR